jgi:hypothetical protein
MPKTIAKERSFKLLEESDYTLIVEKASEKVSKKGYPMLSITFGVEGRSEKIFEYLVFSDKDFCREKLTQFQRGLGIVVKEGDEIEIEAEDITGAEIQAHVKIQKDETFGDKNVVSYYYDKTKESSPEKF